MTNRRRFGSGTLTPSTLRSVRERRELVVSFSIVAALQVDIAGALAICGLQTYRMWHQGVAYLPGDVARTVPVFLLLGSLFALFAASRSIRRVRSIRGTPVAPGPAE